MFIFFPDILGIRRQLDTGTHCVQIVGNEGSVVTQDTGQLAIVTRHLPRVARNGTFRHLIDWQHIADLQLSALSPVQDLSVV